MLRWTFQNEFALPPHTEKRSSPATPVADAPISFGQLFWLVFRWRPLQAIEALYWHLTKRRVRARNRLLFGSAQSPHLYDAWIATVEQRHLRRQEAAEAAELTDLPIQFSVLLGWDTSDLHALQQQLKALERQSSTKWEAVVVAPPEAAEILSLSSRVSRIAPRGNDGESLEAAIAAAKGDWIVPMPAGVRLADSALSRFAAFASEGSAVLYSDEDLIDAKGRRTRPWLKPEWNLELFYAQDYLCTACALKRVHLRAERPLEASAPVHDLLIALIAEFPSLVPTHVPEILFHWPEGHDWQLSSASVEARIRALSHSLRSQAASVSTGPFGSVRVLWPAPSPPPLVSIVVPTRDKKHLLEACLSSLLRQTTYPRYEVLVVDNGSVEASALDYLTLVGHDDRVTVLPYPAPYNYSAINNWAIQQASGDYICLLNNDTEVVTPDWLDAMMRHAVRPHVGAVGARLLYADYSVQHAGVAIGLGNAAGHAHRGLPDGEPGYFARSYMPHYVSAVTAACLVVERNAYERVGGLDEQKFKVAYNDVDLCLKLRAAGLTNVYEPNAVLLHHESKSRGSDMALEHRPRYLAELAELQRKWHTADYVDPLHHPALDRASETFVLSL